MPVGKVAHVANDPVNGRDPTGTYSCTGTRICPEFSKAQKEAIAQVKAGIAQLKQLAGAIKSGGAIPTSAQSMAKQMESYIGKGSSRSMGAVLGLESRGYRALSGLLDGSKVASFDPSLAVGAGNAIPNRVYFGDHPTKATVFHESSHETSFAAKGGLVRDNASRLMGQYGEAAARALAQEGGPSWTLRTANSLTFAYGFDDGD